MEIIVDKMGIIKEVDALGRLQIPKDIRKRLGLGSSVELIITADGLLIKSVDYVLVKKEINNGALPLDKPVLKL